MRSLAHCFEDEVTDVLDRLGALVQRPALTVSAHTPLAEVRRLLVHHREPAIAVMDDEDRLCGIITRTDVLRVYGELDASAEDAMSSFVFTLPPSAYVEKAAALMAVEGVGQVLVVERDGRLLGMVSAVDIARHFAALAGYAIT